MIINTALGVIITRLKERQALLHTVLVLDILDPLRTAISYAINFYVMALKHQKTISVQHINKKTPADFLSATTSSVGLSYTRRCASIFPKIFLNMKTAVKR
jgi:hypothetical protein